MERAGRNCISGVFGGQVPRRIGRELVFGCVREGMLECLLRLVGEGGRLEGDGDSQLVLMRLGSWAVS